MLKSWQVEHFKALVETPALEFGYVTILTGLNNAGKSSLLQSILMITDTLSSPLKELPLLPVSASHSGIDNAILSYTASDQMLSFNFELMVPVKKDEHTAAPPYQSEACVGRAVKVALRFRFEQVQHNTRFAIGQYGIRFFNNTVPVIQDLEITFPAMNEGDEEIAFRLDSVSEEMKQDAAQQEPVPHYRQARRRKPSYSGHFSVNGQQLPGKYQVQDFVHFLPRRLHLSPSSTTQPKQVKQLEGKYFSLLSSTVEQIEHFFSQQVYYLGPQRTDVSPSQRSMPAGKNRLGDVGSKGEYAAALYSKHHTEEIAWYDPERQQIRNSVLEDAVNCWVQYLGVASRVKTQESAHGTPGWQLEQPDGTFHPLSASGSSLKQVLPLLVMGLLAAPGSLLLVEQLELSLHQSAQAELGDFFVGLAMCGKQSIIETQSENLVAQLRYHIVREGGHDPDRYMLYFADHDDNGFAQFTSIEISPRGAIVNWPEGFFSETPIQEENIRFAYMKKKFEAPAQKTGERHVVQQGGEQAQDAEHSS